MPEWVIVGSDRNDTPVVLADWFFELSWTAIDNVKSGKAVPAVFRDRWRAKRQYRRCPPMTGARCIHRERL